MRLLLDTHTFLWWNQNAPQLSHTASQLIQDSRNQVYLSAASTWEIAIKVGRSRLILPAPLDQFMTESIQANAFSPLPIEVSHTLEVYNLPALHADPFDRILIAQSRMEHIPLLTADTEIAKYDVEILW